MEESYAMRKECHSCHIRVSTVREVAADSTAFSDFREVLLTLRGKTYCDKGKIKFWGFYIAM